MTIEIHIDTDRIINDLLMMCLFHVEYFAFVKDIGYTVASITT